jgi:hypothetical protein
MAEIVADETVPGLYKPSEKVVGTARMGARKYELLADGCLFLSEWRGALETERMVSHTLLSAGDVKALTRLLKA